ncbi:MAG: two-component sensor histidine kinase, partial [Bacteroidaceae bacterium]|nr:two-component sensor histidine kinase [Bacteroidaceae bacterium]
MMVIISGLIMGFSFISLLYLQVMYLEEMVAMRKEQFSESVQRVLSVAARNLELNETQRYLERDVAATKRQSQEDSIQIHKENASDIIQHTHQQTVTAKDGTIYNSFELKTVTIRPSDSKAMMMRGRDKSRSIAEASQSLQEIVKNRYVYQRALLDEVVYKILYTASDKPLAERINFKLLDQDLKSELTNNGIGIPYHFRVT